MKTPTRRALSHDWVLWFHLFIAAWFVVDDGFSIWFWLESAELFQNSSNFESHRFNRCGDGFVFRGNNFFNHFLKGGGGLVVNQGVGGVDVSSFLGRVCGCAEQNGFKGGVMTQAQTTFYPNLRANLSPQFAGFSDADLEGMFESAFGEGVSPAEYEEFFGGLGRALSSAASSVGRFAQQNAPGIAQIGQGALQGAMAGSAAGPWGAAIGALTGGVGSGLSHYGTGTVRDVGNVMGGMVNTAGALTGRGAMAGGISSLAGGLLGGRGGGAGGISSLLASLGGRSGGGGAAGALMGLLGRPETMNALQSLAGGNGGMVPVGARGTPVPANAFAGLIRSLATEAEAESFSGEAGESAPGYLMNAAGQFIVDPSQPDHRAAHLLQMLASAPRAYPYPMPMPRVPFESLEAEAEGFSFESEAEAESYSDWGA
jgi:hypothetical protein